MFDWLAFGPRKRRFFRTIAILSLTLMFSLVSLGNTSALAFRLKDVTKTHPTVDLLPNGKAWQAHLKNDLLPFWDTDTALGDPVGNFPTYRCNDGSLYDPLGPCPELEHADPGIVNLARDYVRAKSRQVYAYGVAYNMTGDKKYLDYAKAGVDFLRDYAIDRIHGGAYTYFETKADGTVVPGPEPEHRISQDMAYAVSGLGFFYYLTRDPDILDDILELKNYIFETYYDRGLDMLTWIEEEFEGNSPDRKELVAQLDQIYGYMLWLAPTLPEPIQSEWKDELVHLAHIIIEQFYTDDKNLFWGAVTSSGVKQYGMPHTDFGHSIKTFWLIYAIGKLTDNIDLTLFAEERIPKLLELAYIPETGSWGRSIEADGTFNANKEWWILAELDQTAATFGLIDPDYAKYLPHTYNYWFTYIVDHENKGVWHGVSAANNQPDATPKQHSWKNAFHSFEHALVAYLTTQQLYGKPSTLYFAFKEVPDETQIQPYLYHGKVKEMTQMCSGNEPLPDYQKYKVVFSDIR